MAKGAKRSAAWYTSTYSTILDSPEYERLSLYASAAWWALKHCPENNQLGIFVFFNEQVRHRAKLQPEHVQDAIRELERGRWAKTDGRWIWLRNHLKFDPHYSPDNPNHVKGLIAKIEALPRMPLLAEFVAYYKTVKHPDTGTAYIPATYKYAMDSHVDGMGDGMGKAIRRPRRAPRKPMGDPVAVAVTDTHTKTEPTEGTGASAPDPWTVQAGHVYERRNGAGTWDARRAIRFNKAAGPLVGNYGPDRVIATWTWYVNRTDEAKPGFLTPEDFAAHFLQWEERHFLQWEERSKAGNVTALARAGPSPTRPATAGEKTVAAVGRFVQRKAGEG